MQFIHINELLYILSFMAGLLAKEDAFLQYFCYLKISVLCAEERRLGGR